MNASAQLNTASLMAKFTKKAKNGMTKKIFATNILAKVNAKLKEHEKLDLVNLAVLLAVTKMVTVLY
jgi:hypothetical protein